MSAVFQVGLLKACDGQLVETVEIVSAIVDPMSCDVLLCMLPMSE